MKQSTDPFGDFEEYDDEDKVASSFKSGVIKRTLSKWWLAVIFLVLGATAGLYYQSTKLDTVTAVAVIEVNQKDMKIIGDDLETDQTKVDTLLATIVAKMSGPEVLNAVVADPVVQAITEMIPPKASLKPVYMRSEEELTFSTANSVTKVELAEYITKCAEVSNERNTTLIRVAVIHPKEKTAKVIADAFARVFVQMESNLKSGGNSKVRGILAKESNVSKADLREAEKSFQVYTQALELSNKVKESREEVVQLRQRYKSLHPKRQHAEGAHKDLLTNFAREINRVVVVPSEQEYWESIAAELKALEVVMTQDDEESYTAADDWFALAQSSLSARSSFLKTTVDQQSASYQATTQRLAELGMAQQNTFDDLKIVEKAYLTPSGRKIIPFAGAIVGLMCGVGIAYFLAMLDYKIHDVQTGEEVSGLSCLAAVMQDSKFGRPTNGVWNSLLISDPSSMNAEALRNLRTSIVLLGKKERHQSILFCSAAPSEGKTSVSVETAAAFALNKEKTVIIDLDLRKPKVSGMFTQLDASIGIVDVLSGQKPLESVIQSSSIENLDVILSGAKVPNPAELLHEEELSALIAKLKQSYDRIIIDSAPVLPVSDTRVIAKFVDDTILVALAHKTPGGAMIRAKELLSKSGGSLAGFVINGIKSKAKGYGYYGYKGYGEYGESYSDGNK
ncbi:MAG: polysaccharide biosynthesis tyrosine autokinase [Patiriisocius sp.]|uniref:polysaccharide biosynthesis tyrosine autokinase n=1 Tax=Patiriisocius sp. TaxID=2822396 RepID=UPI003EF46464